VSDDQRRDAETRYLAAHLQEILARDPRVNAPELRLSMGGDAVVVVEGILPTSERRDAVDIVILEACPDVRVENRTTLADYEGDIKPEAIT
jgi:hypothetical protein